MGDHQKHGGHAQKTAWKESSATSVSSLLLVESFSRQVIFCGSVSMERSKAPMRNNQGSFGASFRLRLKIAISQLLRRKKRKARAILIGTMPPPLTSPGRRVGGLCKISCHTQSNKRNLSPTDVMPWLEGFI